MNGYLAGAIDHNTETHDWKEKLKKYIRTIHPDTVFYNPKEAFSAGELSPSAADFVVLVNSRALQLCDFVVVRLSTKSSSVGTPIELDQAIQMGKSVVIFTDMEKSFYIKYYENQGAKVVFKEELLNTTVNNLIGDLRKEEVRLKYAHQKIHDLTAPGDA